MEETKLPGTLLAVVGAINVLLGLANMGFGGFTAATGPSEALASGIGSAVGGLVGLVIAGVIIFGGLKMRSGESYNLAMAASVLAMIPLCSPCCILGLPIGIWAIITLRKDEVKNNFR
jgi:hypothetical protein